MGVETATFIGDLNPTDPGSSDLINQGDDHLRLIKTVLQNSFPGMEKAIYFPATAQKSANFSVLAADMNKTFFVTTTSGAIVMTLPSTLGTSDAGWECFLMKASADVNPVQVTPATGTITSGQIPGLATARRSIPFTRISIYWMGSSFIVSRATQAGPVGTCIEYHGASLPYGYEFPNGQTLSSASTAYPEYSAVIGSGVTLDKRGRTSLALDNLGGSAAGRVGSIINGTAIGNVAGTEVVTLTAAQIPVITSAGPALSVAATGGTSSVLLTSSVVNLSGGGSGVNVPTSAGSASVSVTGSTSGQNVTSNNAGGGFHSNLQPSIMVSQLLVVE